MRRAVLRSAIACAAILLSAAAASAQINTFMLVPGIPGGSLDARHVGWIDVASLEQSLATLRKGSACQIGVQKPLDVAGPKLWLAAVTGQVFNEVRIEVFRSAADPVKVFEVRLQNAIVASISDSSGGATLAESVAWTAQSITLSVFPQNPDGTTGTPVTATVPCQ